MRSHLFITAVLFFGARAGANRSLDDAALGLLDSYPNIKSALSSEISEWSTSTEEASSFLCSIWSGKTPSPIAAVLTVSSNSNLSSEWIALSTGVSSIVAKSEIPAIDSACSTLFAGVATTASPGQAVTVTATVTVTALPSQLPQAGLSPPSGQSLPTAINPTASLKSPATSTAASQASSTSCKKYYKVVSGDTCSSIASNEGISESSIEQLNPSMCGVDLQIGMKLCVSGPLPSSTNLFQNVTSIAASGTTQTRGSPSASNSSQTCAPNSCCGYYQVASGDSCYSIATSQGISESSIEQWNPGRCGPNLQVGAELCISGPPKGAASPFSSFNNPSSTIMSPLSTTSTSMSASFSSTGPCPVDACCEYYKVVSGDSCDSIATIKDIPEPSIEQWNPNECGPDLQIGMELCINGPATGSAPPYGTCSPSSTNQCCRYEKIVSGDTCYNISTKLGIAESLIETWNPGSCGPNLKIGGSLCTKATLGYNGTAASSSITGTGTAASSSSVPARVNNSQGHRLLAWGVEGFLGLVIGVALVF